MQVGAMCDPVGKMVSLLDPGTERQRCDRPSRATVMDPQPLRPADAAFQPGGDAQPGQDPDGIRAELNTGAGLDGIATAFQHATANPVPGQCDGECQAADAPPTIRTGGRPSREWSLSDAALSNEAARRVRLSRAAAGHRLKRRAYPQSPAFAPRSRKMCGGRKAAARHAIEPLDADEDFVDALSLRNEGHVVGHSLALAALILSHARVTKPAPPAIGSEGSVATERGVLPCRPFSRWSEIALPRRRQAIRSC